MDISGVGIEETFSLRPHAPMLGRESSVCFCDQPLKLMNIFAVGVVEKHCCACGEVHYLEVNF